MKPVVGLYCSSSCVYTFGGADSPALKKCKQKSLLSSSSAPRRRVLQEAFRISFVVTYELKNCKDNGKVSAFGEIATTIKLIFLLQFL